MCLLDWLTSWARAVIAEKFGSLAPFSDKIELGAKADLPKTFEKATVVAKRLPVERLVEPEIWELLTEASERLRELYVAQQQGRDLSPAQLTELQLEAVSRPLKRRHTGQGFGLSSEARRAIELQAMEVSREWLESSGYAVRDTSATSPFDFEASKDGGTLKVEVKGTTSDEANSLFMTRNEVELHRVEKGFTALFVVSQIRIEQGQGAVSANGGVLSPFIGWDIDGWELVPIAFQLSKRRTV